MKVVFDTNVVASASFWKGPPLACLAAWAQGKCQAFVSPPLLVEYAETFAELRGDYPQRPAVDWTAALAGAAELVFPTHSARGATPDPDDEMVLECALAAEADFIVSGDRKHLLSLGSFQGIRIASPAEFLRHLT